MNRFLEKDFKPEDNNQLKVIVALHKQYRVKQDSVYLPVQVGASAANQDMGYQRDDQGQSISQKNTLYCELTGLYWAWKNLSAEALGIVHYRRYLGHPSRHRPWIGRWAQIATGKELEQMLEERQILLPKKRNYVIESREDQFIHAHGKTAMDVLRLVMKERSAQYLPAFERTMRRTSGHIFNMFVMRRDLCDAYCTWLFDTLFEVEAFMRKNMPQEIKPRLFGYLAERMLDCWIETNGYSYTELPVVNIEKQNWLKKGTAFLIRRFGLNGSKCK